RCKACTSSALANVSTTTPFVSSDQRAPRLTYAASYLQCVSSGPPGVVPISSAHSRSHQLARRSNQQPSQESGPSQCGDENRAGETNSRIDHARNVRQIPLMSREC